MADRSILHELYEAWTSDSPGDPRFPLYTCAPTDGDAAAPGSPFVNGISYLGNGAMQVRFWCLDRPSAPELRVDFEPLVQSFLWRSGPVLATAPFVAAMITGAYFERYTDGWYRSKGVRSIHFRDMRDRSVITVDHTRVFDEARDLEPLIVRAQ